MKLITEQKVGRSSVFYVESDVGSIVTEKRTVNGEIGGGL